MRGQMTFRVVRRVAWRGNDARPNCRTVHERQALASVGACAGVVTEDPGITPASYVRHPSAGVILRSADHKDQRAPEGKSDWEARGRFCRGPS